MFTILHSNDLLLQVPCMKMSCALCPTGLDVTCHSSIRSARGLLSFQNSSIVHITFWLHGPMDPAHLLSSGVKALMLANQRLEQSCMQGCTKLLRQKN